MSGVFSITRIGMGPMSMPSSAAAAFESATSRPRKPSSVQARATSSAPRAGLRVSMCSIWARISSAEKIPFSTRRLVTAICMS